MLLKLRSEDEVKLRVGEITLLSSSGIPDVSVPHLSVTSSCSLFCFSEFDSKVERRSFLTVCRSSSPCITTKDDSNHNGK